MAGRLLDEPQRESGGWIPLHDTKRARTSAGGFFRCFFGRGSYYTHLYRLIRTSHERLNSHHEPTRMTQWSVSDAWCRWKLPCCETCVSGVPGVPWWYFWASSSLKIWTKSGETYKQASFIRKKKHMISGVPIFLRFNKKVTLFVFEVGGEKRSAFF